MSSPLVVSGVCAEMALQGIEFRDTEARGREVLSSEAKDTEFRDSKVWGSN